MDRIGELVSISCPDCGGPLWELNDQPSSRLRCHTDHTFGMESLVTGFSAVTERSPDTLRVMDEKTHIFERLAADNEKRNHKGRAADFKRRAEESRTDADHIRQLLTGQIGQP